MATEKPYIMVTDVSDLVDVREISDQYEIAAGSYHVWSALTKIGYTVLAPGTDWDESGKAEILQQVADVAQTASSSLEQFEFTAAQKATMLAKLVQASFQYFAHDAAENKIGKKIIKSLVDVKQSPANLSQVRESGLWSKIVTRRNHLLFLRRALRRGKLDFRSPSGVKLGDRYQKVESIRVIARLDDHPLGPLRNWRSNLWHGYVKRKKDSDWRLLINLPYVHQNYPEGLRAKISSTTGPRIGGFVNDVLSNSLCIFETYYCAMKNFLADANYVPSIALFNHAQTEVTAGFATALRDRGAITSMVSQGGLVVHGSQARVVVSEILAGAIYNYHPSMRQVAPRSPMQVGPAWNASVIRQVRIKDSDHSRSSDERPFKVVYAPNFVSWYECFHGLSASCFETRVCAERLSSAVKRLDGVNLFIRIKTTNADVSEKGVENSSRGLTPSDLSDLIDEQSGVFDASHGSHAGLIADSNLVITEGVSTVMFEALEHRKPVLLLNQHPLRTPSLPSFNAAELTTGSSRHAVYSASSEDDLDLIISQILDLHKDQPLNEYELRPYVWTGSDD